MNIDNGIVELDAGADEPEEGAPDEAAAKLPRGATLNEDGTVTLKLRFPVDQQVRRDGTISTKTYDTLVLHRLKGADVTAIGEAPRGKQGQLGIALSSRMSPLLFAKIFDKMDAVDITAAAEVLGHFLGNGPTTGA